MLNFVLDMPFTTKHMLSIKELQLSQMNSSIDLLFVCSKLTEVDSSKLYNKP